MELLATRKFCETCGSSVDFEMPSGFCPGCLLNTVLETESEIAAGSRIEDYELLNEVARGGMGIVYRARQRAPSRIVALKMILPAHLSSLGAVNRFRAESGGGGESRSRMHSADLCGRRTRRCAILQHEVPGGRHAVRAH